MSMAIWRFTLVLAGALIGATVWLGYEMLQTIRFLASVADLLGRPEAMQWGNVALGLATLGVCGILLPALYSAWAWQRAFPKATP